MPVSLDIELDVMIVAFVTMQLVFKNTRPSHLNLRPKDILTVRCDTYVQNNYIYSPTCSAFSPSIHKCTSILYKASQIWRRVGYLDNMYKAHD